MRAWREGSSHAPLRVELRGTHDISSGVETSGTFAEVAEVLAAVEQWLLEMREAPAVSGGDGLSVVPETTHGSE